MSFSALNWAMKQKAGSAGAKLLLIVLGDRAGDDGSTFTPVEALAEATEQDGGAVRAHLRELGRLGLIFRAPDVFGPSCVTVLLSDAVSIARAVESGYAPAAVLADGSAP